MISRRGSGSALSSIVGNGFLAKAGDQMVPRDVGAVYPLTCLNGTGTGGPLTFLSASQCVIAKGRIDGEITADQPLEVIGASVYLPRAIVFGRASAVPVEMEGGVYTAEGKTGRILAPADTVFTDLTGPKSIKEVAVTLDETCTAPWIYVSLTTANGDPVEVDVWVIGDVLEYATS